MALKAGRVGVAPDQVDDFGNVKSGYTKQEADVKFATNTDVRKWTSYTKKLVVNENDLGTFEIDINSAIKIFTAKFVGNSKEIPVGTHTVDFSDVLPENIKPHGEWVGWLRGSNNAVIVHGSTKVLAVSVVTAGSWYGGFVTGTLDTGIV